MNRENREGEEEMAENKGANEGTKREKGFECCKSSVIFSKGVVFRPNVPSVKDQDPPVSLLLVPTFRDLLVRIMKARILPSIVLESTMPDIVYFFHKA